MSKIPLSLQKMLQILQLNLFSKGGIEELFKPPKKRKISNKNSLLDLMN
jgi:hypothetical protein